MTNFKAGDKVVCIATSWPDKRFSSSNEPKCGATYLVTGVIDSQSLDGKPGIGLFIAGCNSHVIKRFLFVFKINGIEASWEARCFIKLITATERSRMEQEVTA